jgi:hypothetical protein
MERSMSDVKRPDQFQKYELLKHLEAHKKRLEEMTWPDILNEVRGIFPKVEITKDVLLRCLKGLKVRFKYKPRAAGEGRPGRYAGLLEKVENLDKAIAALCRTVDELSRRLKDVHSVAMTNQSAVKRMQNDIDVAVEMMSRKAVG